ncbi:MAG: P-loop NTPase [Dehalococcoidales bacterium]|nr:P-loop NTPase [Dehalococcoidales bacterium]
MGLFHCPLGAPFYEGDGCITCGLCLAKTEEEMVKASRVIRSYIKEHTPRRSKFQKIAVCGKGGAGKSTFTALLALALAQQLYKVTVLDADESNPGLYKMLGITRPPQPVMNIMNKICPADITPGTPAGQPPALTLKDLPPEYIARANNVSFIVAGKILDPFQGCACELADMTSKLMLCLKLADTEKIVIDTEAGIESFGRGVERYVDTVFIMVEPSLESIEVADRVKYMADGIGISAVKAVLNKVSSPALEERMIAELNRRGITSIGIIHHDEVISEMNFTGGALGPSQASREVQKIVSDIIIKG